VNTLLAFVFKPARKADGTPTAGYYRLKYDF
jgi:hypothetical protein